MTVTLFIAMLAPGPFLVIIAGRILKAEIPNPNALAMVVGSLVFLLLCVCGMIAGATAWLLAARRFAERNVIEPFFVYPGVPLFSALAAKILAWAYRPPSDRQQ